MRYLSRKSFFATLPWRSAAASAKAKLVISLFSQAFCDNFCYWLGKMLLEMLSKEKLVATVHFSIPDEVKELFDSAFAGQNRSAVIAKLMRDAAEHELSLRRRRKAVAEVLRERTATAPVSADRVHEALEELRR